MKLTYVPPARPGPSGESVEVDIEVNGVPRMLRVSREAMEDHFGATPHDMLFVFEKNVTAVMNVVANRVVPGHTGLLTLGTTDF